MRSVLLVLALSTFTLLFACRDECEHYQLIELEKKDYPEWMEKDLEYNYIADMVNTTFFLEKYETSHGYLRDLKGFQYSSCRYFEAYTSYWLSPDARYRAQCSYFGGDTSRYLFEFLDQTDMRQYVFIFKSDGSQQNNEVYAADLIYSGIETDDKGLKYFKLDGAPFELKRLP